MKTEFLWEQIGDIEKGRKNLGANIPVEIYRLMQLTIIEELQEQFDEQTAQNLIRQFGFRAGQALARNKLNLEADFHSFVWELQKILKDFKIGILKIEESNIETLEFIMTVDEDLDCSGMPVLGSTVCFYDEGFLSGIMEAYTKKRFAVHEIDCWATGGRTCRFSVSPIQ